MTTPDAEARLDALPRRGWVDRPTPVERLPELEPELGVDWFGVKRDDLLDALGGGGKVRKLDHLLAVPPLVDAPMWATVGAIGSGHLVAVVKAAALLERRVRAHVFWTEPTPEAQNTLGFLASGPTEIVPYRSRASLALFGAAVLTRPTAGGLPAIPPGGTTPLGMLGFVRAAFELAAQIRAGALPSPDVIALPLGSGGTAAGLLVGLALAGVDAELRLGSAVERPLATAGRLRRVVGELTRYLAELGIAVPALPRFTIGYRHAGPAYGRPSVESRRMAERFAPLGIAIEPIYGGKAMAELFARPGGRRVLYWVTARKAGPLPVEPGWEARLPASFRRRLAAPEPGRRRALALVASAALTGGLASRALPRPSERERPTLDAAEVSTLAAWAEVLLDPAPAREELDELLDRADAFVGRLPPARRDETRLALFALEQVAPILGGELTRTIGVPPAERRALIVRLLARTDPIGDAARGIRELVMLTAYSGKTRWAALEYRGPWVEPGRPDPYRALIAPATASPKSEAP